MRSLVHFVLVASLLVPAASLSGEAAGDEARRIVSLAPSVTETLFALGAGDEVVGVTDFCDHPPAAAERTRVGSYVSPNVEAVLALRPTDVVTVRSPGNRNAVETLQRAGLRVRVVPEGPGLAEVYSAIEAVAEAAGRPEAGRRLQASIARDVRRVREAVAGRPTRSAIVAVGRAPLMVAGEGTLVGELLRLAGATNAAAGLGQWPRLSLERLVQLDPDVVLDTSMGNEVDGAPVYADLGLRAAERGRVYAIQFDEILRPGPRVAAGVEALARRIHPEAFSD